MLTIGRRYLFFILKCCFVAVMLVHGVKTYCQEQVNTCQLANLMQIAVCAQTGTLPLLDTMQFKPWHQVFTSNQVKYRNHHFTYWFRLPEHARTGVWQAGGTKQFIYLGQRHNQIKAYKLNAGSFEQVSISPKFEDAYTSFLFEVDTSELYFAIEPAPFRTRNFCPEIHTQQSWQAKQIHFFQRNKVQIVMWYALIAILSFTAIIGFAHFVAIRDLTYLYFALFLLTQIVNFYSHRLEFLFINTESLKWITTHGNQVSSYLGHLFYFAFFAEYLNLKRYASGIHRLLFGVSVLLLACFILHFILFYGFDRQDLALSIYYQIRNGLVVFVLVALCVLMIKKIPFLSFIIPATLIVLGAAIFWLWFGQSGLPEGYFRFHPGMWYYASVAVQALILQTGLSYRYKKLLQEKTETALALVNERTRISRDLHDHLATGLTTLELQMQDASATGSVPQARLSMFTSKLRETQDILRTIIWMTKQNQITLIDIVSKLRDYFLHSQNLPTSAIKFEMDQTAAQSLVLQGKQGWELFLILKEGLHNMEKHAQATKALICFRLQDQMMHVKMQDNGIGFELAAISNGFGLENMRTRVAQLGGNMEIHSEKSQGTTIQFSFPLTE